MSSSTSQLRQDSEYCREYRAWFLSLPAAERKRMAALGLDKPDASRQIAGARDRVGLETLDHLMQRNASPLLDQHTQSNDSLADQDQTAGGGDTVSKAELADVLAAYMHWVINPHPLGKGTLNPKAVAQRAIMATWVLRPDMIKGRTLTELSRILDTKAEVLSRQASSFSNRFGIKGRCQYSQQTRRRMRAAKTREAVVAVGDEQEGQLPLSMPLDPSLN